MNPRVAQNDIEKANLEQYKEKIALIESEQAKLDKNRGEAKSLRVKRGKTSEETRRLKQLDIDATLKRMLLVFTRNEVMFAICARRQTSFKNALLSTDKGAFFIGAEGGVCYSG